MPNPELDAISIPELRRRVDTAVAHIREMRNALAVEAGMTLERAPGPIPEVDVAEGKAALDQMMAMLPLLRRRLTPEERAALRPVSEAQREQMKEIADELVANKDAYERLAEGSEMPPFEQIVKLRESFDKSEMLREFERELRALLEDMKAFRQRMEDELEAEAALLAKRGQPS